jgi:phenylacetate 2-hydroxylase
MVLTSLHLEFEGSRTDLGTDVDHFGPSASIFNPERWLTSDGSIDPASEKTSTGIQHFSFGAGSRACSGQIIASRLLYTALIRIICSYRIVASESQPPNTDYVDYNQFKSALVAIPRDFKVKLIPRDGMEGGNEVGTLEECLEEARARTEGYYKEDEEVKI